MMVAKLGALDGLDFITNTCFSIVDLDVKIRMTEVYHKQNEHAAEEHVNYVIDHFLGPGKNRELSSVGDMNMPSASVRSAMIAAAK